MAAINLHNSMLMILSPCFLIFIFTGFSVATSTLPSNNINPLHSHDLPEKVDGSKELFYPTSSTKTRSNVDEAPRSTYIRSPLRGRKMKNEDAVSTNSAKHQVEKEEEEKMLSMAEKHINYIEKEAKKKRVYDKDSFVDCADYGGPHRHPPKNN